MSLEAEPRASGTASSCSAARWSPILPNLLFLVTWLSHVASELTNEAAIISKVLPSIAVYEVCGCGSARLPVLVVWVDHWVPYARRRELAPESFLISTCTPWHAHSPTPNTHTHKWNFKSCFLKKTCSCVRWAISKIIRLKRMNLRTLEQGLITCVVVRWLYVSVLSAFTSAVWLWTSMLSVCRS